MIVFYICSFLRALDTVVILCKYIFIKFNEIYNKLKLFNELFIKPKYYFFDFDKNALTFDA